MGKKYGGPGNVKIGPYVTINQRSVLRATPLMRQRKLGLAIGRAIAFAVEDRVRNDEKGPSGRRMGPFEVSGGMWGGFDIRANKSNAVVAQFYRSSLSASFAQRHIKKDPKALKKLVKARRKQGKDPKVRNRTKALSALESQRKKGAAKGREILEPTRQEVDTIYSWLEAHLDKGLIQGLKEPFNSKTFKSKSRYVRKRLPLP